MRENEEDDGRPMMSKDEMMKYLKEVFGINSEEELSKAIKAMTPLNIGIMTTGGKNSDNNTRVARIGVQ